MSAELKPYTEKKRTLCPFYGFNEMFGRLRDSKGNQCALITDSYSPCSRDKDKEKPNWNECHFNVDGIRKKLKERAENMKVFPKEFRPPEAESWEGISLRDWMDYVMNQK